MTAPPTAFEGGGTELVKKTFGKKCTARGVKDIRGQGTLNNCGMEIVSFEAI